MVCDNSIPHWACVFFISWLMAIKMLTIIGIVYSKCSGTRSVDPASPLANTPLTLDSTMWIASCTKLLTAICAVQCVEKGLLNLEDDISAVLPEWKTRNVLLGFEEGTGKPISREAKGTINLRMLLTHNSGMGYPFLSPTLMQYQKYQTTAGKPISELIVRFPPWT
jgi:CubicO group peptidase (beta-lactamase class C family)